MPGLQRFFSAVLLGVTCLSLSGCWPLGAARKGKYPHPEAPYELVAHDSLHGYSIRTLAYREVVPGPDCDCDLGGLKSNNNTDLIFHNGQWFMAFRNAHNHFPSRKSRIFVARSSDARTWTCEHRIWMDHDLREPRFYVHNGRLFLMFFMGGQSQFRFQPQKVFALQREADGVWSRMREVPALKHHVPWRVRERNGQLYLSAYQGLRLYQKNNRCEVRLFTTPDGWTWQPLHAAPQVPPPSAEEAEIIFDKQGNLWSLVRSEGYGGFLAFAPHDSLDCWQMEFTDKKYDSALFFRYRDAIYLVARRNPSGLKFDGRNPKTTLLRYWYSPKRTALYRLDTQRRRIDWLMDLPGRGDTAFASIWPIPNREGRFLLLNYSNRPEGRDYWWFKGQLKPTLIYALELQLDPLNP